MSTVDNGMISQNDMCYDNILTNCDPNQQTPSEGHSYLKWKKHIFLLQCAKFYITVEGIDGHIFTRNVPLHVSE